MKCYIQTALATFMIEEANLKSYRNVLSELRLQWAVETNRDSFTIVILLLADSKLMTQVL
jgi:hypothetical protein